MMREEIQGQNLGACTFFKEAKGEIHNKGDFKNQSQKVERNLLISAYCILGTLHPLSLVLANPWKARYYQPLFKDEKTVYGRTYS